MKSFIELHKNGRAHSVEIWKKNILVGGVYGLSIGSAFFAESMYSSIKDASKIALIFLLAKLSRADFKLFDIQFLTPHLSSMGGIEISKKKYLAYLNSSINEERIFPNIDSKSEKDWLIVSNYLQEIRDIS